MAPAVDEVAENVHDEVLVGDERTEGDEQPAHQLVVLGSKCVIQRFYQFLFPIAFIILHDHTSKRFNRNWLHYWVIPP